jgi:UDP-glucose-4-epimerase GalE
VPAGAHFEPGEVADQARLETLLRRYHVTGVLHFAAWIEVGESMREPGKYFANNYGAPLALLEAMRRAEVRDIVLSSTAAVYGLPETVPIREDAPLRPINPYGLSKLQLEMALAWAARSHGMRYAALRYFNAAGATATRGERHEPETHLIPRVLAAAAGDGPAIEIYGDDYDTPDGTCIRDYIHVRDLAQAHVIALGRLAAEPDVAAPAAAPPDLADRAYNLGNGRGFSVQEVIAAVARVSGRSVPVRHAVRREGDPPRLIAAADKMLAAGWRPELAELEAIVASAWRWRQARIA